MPPVFGHLDTHVIDETVGRPAAGVRVELVDFMGERPRPVAEASTNAQGRLDAALIANRPVPIGRYELRFGIGEYFAAAARRQASGRSSTSCRCVSLSATPRPAIMCRCCARRSAIRPTRATEPGKGTIS